MKKSPRQPIVVTTDKGRPLTYQYEKKSPHNISVTQNAWKGIQSQANVRNLSVSELIEQIGRENFLIVANRDLNIKSDSISIEVPILPRLKHFLTPPTSLFRSLSGFIARTGKQLNLVRNTIEQAELLKDVLLKSLTIVVLISHVYPDRYINNPEALIRYISYQMLINRSANITYTLRDDFNQNSVNALSSNLLWRIHESLSILENSLPSHYQIIKMRFFESLTWSQILNFKKLHGNIISMLELVTEVKQALYELRQIYHSSPKEYNNNVSFQPGEPIQKYYQYSILPKLDEDGRQKISEILSNLIMQKGDDIIKQHTFQDFWINEIDHFLGHELCIFTSEYDELQDRVLEFLKENMESYILEKIEQIDRKLKYSIESEEIQKVLMHMIREEAKTDMPALRTIWNCAEII